MYVCVYMYMYICILCRSNFAFVHYLASKGREPE